MSTYKLRIITPERVFYDDEVDRIVLKGVEGDMAVLAEHKPLTTILSMGELRVYEDRKKYRSATLLGGFAKIEPHEVVILTDAAEWPEEIDIERARKAQERAAERLKQSDLDLVRAEAALQRAVVRMKVAQTLKRD